MANKIFRRAFGAAALASMTAYGAAALSEERSSSALQAEPASLPAISKEEHARTMAAMRPPKRARPVIAVVGANEGTETTDYVIPYAVLKESGVADVVALGTKAGALVLNPALVIEPQATTAEFDRLYPEGADYVIVPALDRDDDPSVVAWIKTQSEKGATIVGVCSGVLVVSAAGLLADHEATGYWWDREELRKANPTTRWVPNRRYVADRGLVTTTGVSASLPVSLALVEAIAGAPRAAALARKLGMPSWSALHDSSAFEKSSRLDRTIAEFRAQMPGRKPAAILVSPGVDELALAFTMDAWARTKRGAFTWSKSGAPVQTRRGLKLISARTSAQSSENTVLGPMSGQYPAKALDRALDGITAKYGANAAWFVALQMEYPYRSSAAKRQVNGVVTSPRLQ